MPAAPLPPTAPLPIPSQEPPAGIHAKQASAAGWTDTEIKTLGTRFREEKDARAKRRAFERLLAGLTAGNALAVHAQIAHLAPHSAEFREFYNAWGRIDEKNALISAAHISRQASVATMAGWAGANPAAALEFFEPLQSNSHNGDGTNNHLSKEYLRLGLARGLADADSGMAMGFVQQQFAANQVDDKCAGDMMRAVAASVVEHQGLAEAMAWAATVPEALRSDALAGVAREYAASDVAATLKWLASFEDTIHQGAAYFHTFAIWAGEDTAAASAYIANMPDSYQRNEAAIAVALQMLGEQSGLALELIAGIPDPATRNRGFSEMFNNWARQDAIAASEYLTTMPESPERDHAIRGFAGSLVVRDPASAIAWTDQIEDPQLRQSSFVTVALSFFENHPNEATTWLPESGLPVDTVNRIINPSPADQNLLNFLTQQ